MSGKLLMAGNIAAVLALIGILIYSGSMVMGDAASIVALARGNSSVTNAGTVDVSLEIGGMTGMVVLPAGESIKVAEEYDVKAEQAN